MLTDLHMMLLEKRRQELILEAEKERLKQHLPNTIHKPILAQTGKKLIDIGVALQERYGNDVRQSPDISIKPA